MDKPALIERTLNNLHTRIMIEAKFWAKDDSIMVYNKHLKGRVLGVIGAYEAIASDLIGPAQAGEHYREYLSMIWGGGDK